MWIKDFLYGKTKQLKHILWFSVGFAVASESFLFAIIALIIAGLCDILCTLIRSSKKAEKEAAGA